jgi:mycothiol synthase
VHCVEVHRQADPTLRTEVEALADAAAAVDGLRFLSDHLWLDLQNGGDVEFRAVTARDERGDVVAYAQASAANDGVVAESTVSPAHRDEPDVEASVLTALIADVGDVDLTWWVHDVAPRHEALATQLGLVAVRDLYQMRRRLPTGMPVTVETRPFDPSRDEGPWLAVNNRAFAAHGEQGGWDLATLRQRESEAWFDPDGFLIHERDGAMAAFCWTKLHHDADPALGEIYVIAVDPGFQGLGLGRQLTLAGLESIHRRGIGTAMLFVDAGNVAAVELYRALGFGIHRTDRAYSRGQPR